MTGYIGKSVQTREVLALLHAGLEHKVPVVIKGKPGVGKTSLIKALAAKTGYEIHILLGSTMDPTDVNGLPSLTHYTYTPDGEETQTVIPITTYAINKWAKDMLIKKRVILFLDELNNAVPAVQSVLLSLIQDRTVGGILLPDEVWIIAAMNAAEDAADGWTLSPPMANRLMHVDFEIDTKDWIDGMLQNWGQEAPGSKPFEEALTSDAPVDAELEKEIQRFQRVSNQRAEIAGFIDQYPHLLVDMPDSRDDAGEAWPSPRSWDNAARLLSSIPKAPETMNIRFRALKGLVGEATAKQYRTYEEELRLPDYAALLNNPSSVDWADLTTAQTKMTIDMVMNRTNAENLVPSLKAIRYYMENSPRTEIVASILAPLGNIIRDCCGNDVRQTIALYQEMVAQPSQKILAEAGITVR